MRTTININNDLLKKFKNTSEILNISTNDLIGMLLSIVISKDTFKITPFQCVKYQDADPDKNWGTLHVSLNPQVYEQDLDLKKCFKFSFSFIISFAIIHFLDELVEKLTQEDEKYKMMDNYPFNYIFIAKKYDGIQGFLVLWGIPDEKTLKDIVP